MSQNPIDQITNNKSKYRLTKVFSRSKGFYPNFFRKDSNPLLTHYCPGCGHGKIHKLLAESLVELGIQDRTVLISPVGCGVFAYYYLDCGNIQAAHGRAPAVATGVKRALPDSLVISYQGDGDLSAIGTSEIIHAANRGEKMTVIFVNNAIYGMTGGQMAPTSLEGQITRTSPYGKNPSTDGYPIRMSEIISTLQAPVFVQRVSVHNYKNIMKAKQAILKAIQSQIDGLGFSFVEILSPCPTSLRLDPWECNSWFENNMIPYYPLKVFKDQTNFQIKPVSVSCYDDSNIYDKLEIKDFNLHPYTKKIPDQRIKIAGFGGQGVISMGLILARIGMNLNMYSSHLPSYGPTMRGGTAHCHVNLLSRPVGSVLVDQPSVLIAMNVASLDEFENSVEPNGTIFVNSSLIQRSVRRKDVKVKYIPATQIAEQSNLIQASNIIMLASYLKSLDIDKNILIDELKSSLKKKQLLDKNIDLVNKVYTLDI